jgi:glucose-6-phosphate 1-epimerase
VRPSASRDIVTIPEGARLLKLEELNSKFGNPHTRFIAGNGNLPQAVLTSPTSTAHVYLHGAHVTHYQQTNQPPLLFLSGKSFFAEDKPIRGGVPVLFPWFGPRHGTDRSQMHGFVRCLPWSVVSTNATADAASLTLATQSSPQTKEIWPHDYTAEYTITAGPFLKLSLTIRNASKESFDFEEGLHTYFAISDISKVSVQGLRGHWYRDRTVMPDPQLDKEDLITFPKRVDRLYRDARTTAVIRDPGFNRQITIAKENSATTVVWNPHQTAEGEFADLDSTDPKHFVCVESCNARENAHTLNPNESHTLTALIATRPLT